jgi:hypothetical protein
MASDNMKHRRLQELGESDFEIVDGQPDIRGWDVRDQNGKKLGEVDELILDAQLRKVRYIVLDTDDNDLDLDDREVLIPIGMAELHEKDDDVILTNITEQHIRSLPEYDSDHLEPDVERNICHVLGRSEIPTMKADADTTFYEHDHFNESNLYRKRLPESTSGSTNAGGMYSGYQLRNRMEQSGNEVFGYSGSTDDESSRSSVRSREFAEDDTAVPVSRTRGDIDQQQANRDLMDGDFLTGDNIRNVSDDLNTRRDSMSNDLSDRSDDLSQRSDRLRNDVSGSMNQGLDSPGNRTDNFLGREEDEDLPGNRRQRGSEDEWRDQGTR